MAANPNINPNHGKKSNKKLVLWLIGGSIAMFGFGFALVPLYDIMCQTLGINGKTATSAKAYTAEQIVDKTRLVNIEFMAQIPPGMNWEFGPQVNTMKVHPGELIRTNFIAKNLSSSAVVGQAVPSVSPGQGALYFHKTECFCFNQQPLAAGADSELPLIFFIDPDLPSSINTLTLSYTLFDVTASSQAALAKVQGATQ
ncbi:cytochrome c oxidase assembly protein [Shewanella sp. OPT22]|nr:cytochrome c oxidase assembly protein [Shewanella sp. OPT22]